MVKGYLCKLTATPARPVDYEWISGDVHVKFNSLIGKRISIKATGNIKCVACESSLSKTYGEGFCWNCFNTLPQNEACVLRPELCKAHFGVARDIKWAEDNHLQPHIVYLSYTNGIKVGVTRETQVPTRWLDQGAVCAIPVLRVPNRYIAGVCEVFLKQYYADKTDFKKMLLEKFPTDVNLINEKHQVYTLLPAELQQYYLSEDELATFLYQVKYYPYITKVINFPGDEMVEGVLSGIKGQYLLFEQGAVINMRNQTGVEVELYY